MSVPDPSRATDPGPARPGRRFRVSPLVACLVACLVAGAVASAVTWHRWGGTRPPVPREHWGLARQALDADDYAAAAGHLRECLDAWPANAEAYFLTARTCRRAGDSAGWRDHLRRAELLQWRPEEVELERRLMRAQSGDVGAVEHALAQNLNAGHPDERLILEALVKGHAEADRWEDVLHWTDLWIANHSDDWQPRYYRGRAFEARRALDRAVADYRRALELSPGRPQARLGLGGALLVDGQFREALEQFDAYLRGQPDDPTALLGAASCRLSLNEADAARAALDRLLSKHPRHAAGLLVRARLDLALGDPAQALNWLNRAEAVAPHETDLTQAFVLTFRQLGNPEEAEKYQRRLEELRRRYDELYRLQREIAKAPGIVAPRYEAGALCLRLGREEEAVRLFQSVLRLDPDHRPTHQALAEFFDKRDPRRAASHRQRAEGPAP